MNPAIAYLVLGCGTGRDNRVTAWSAQAVSEYGGIAWVRAKPAIQLLCSEGFVTQTQAGSRPRCELIDWSDVQQARIARLPELDACSAKVYDQIAQGNQPRSASQLNAAKELVRIGRLWCSGGNYRTEPLGYDDPQPDQCIWLPQTLVMGTNAGEDAPVARIRRTRDVLTLRLLVDLYHAQHLRDDGGVSRTVVYEKYDRSQVGEQGIYNVWSFSPASRYVKPHFITQPHWQKQDDELLFWKRLKCLEEQGIIDFVPHLWESDSVDAEVIHPYGVDWSAKGLENLENAVGRAAHRAGRVMGKADQVDKAGRCFAPVPRDYPEVQMIGIARLRYRPHTKQTSEWWARIQSRLPGILKQYEALRERTMAKLDIKGNQGMSRDINGFQRQSRSLMV